MDEISLGKLSSDETTSIRKIVGANILSKRGMLIGKVADIRVNPSNSGFVGIICRRKFFKKFFIGKDYVNKISTDAVVLNIEPSILFKGKKVITFDGKVIGKVSSIVRKERSNDIQFIVIKRLFRKPISIPYSKVKSYDQSIMLSVDHNDLK